MTKEEQVDAATAYATWFKQTTGSPIIVTPNQMKFFRDAGVDCSNLLVSPLWPGR